jgi:RNA polymerase sigma-70 factor, ECF subfamily
MPLWGFSALVYAPSRFVPPRHPSERADLWPRLRLSGAPCDGNVTVESPTSEVDLSLLQRIALRDEGALAAFYDRHSRLAYTVIVRIVGSSSEAEELLQETFVRVWSRAETYDAVLGSPITWLTRIARNRAIDRLRAGRNRASVVVDLAVDADDSPGVAEPISHDTPETMLEGRTVAGAVRTALATLAPVQRTLIEAAFFEGYTHSELAIRFGLPLGTVKTRIRAGLTAMRGQLEQVI